MSQAARANVQTKQVYYDTSVGTIEILFDEATSIVSIYRFDHRGRPVAAAFENWEFRDLAEVLSAEAGVPPAEAEEMAATLAERWGVETTQPYLSEATSPDAPRRPARRRPTGFLFNLISLAAALGLLALLAFGFWAVLQTLP